MNQHTGASEEVSNAMNAIAKNSADNLGSAMKFLQAWVEFSHTRWNRYFDIPNQVMKCDSPQEIFAMQLEFLRESRLDYLKHFRRMTEDLLEIDLENQGLDDGARREKYAEAILKSQEDAEKIIELAKDQAARIIAEAERRVGHAPSVDREQEDREQDAKVA